MPSTEAQKKACQKWRESNRKKSIELAKAYYEKNKEMVKRKRRERYRAQQNQKILDFILS